MGERRGATVLGGILIVVGVLLLLGEVTGIDVARYGWPLFVIVPGLVFLAFAVGSAPGPGTSLAIPGAIITTTGLILAFQNAYDAFQTWAYAWALAGPTAAGVGIALAGMLHGNRGVARRGLDIAGIGLVLFVAFGAFFEGLLHLSGTNLGALGAIGFPLALIVLGAILLFTRLGR